MKKPAAALVLFLLALPIAGTFGELHDQLSYTVSPEYYTRFKFIQFHLLATSVPDRIRAAEVGWLASWWMGIPIAVLIVPVALTQRTGGEVLQQGLRSYLVLVGFTALTSIGGLVYGLTQTRVLDLRNYSGWFIPPDLQDPRAFVCTGYMHNAAYLGGIAGVPVAWLYLVIARLISRPRT